jgi:hypothetical protein
MADVDRIRNVAMLAVFAGNSATLHYWQGEVVSLYSVGFWLIHS